MSDDLSTALAALGVPQPSQVATPTDPDATDLIAAAIRPLFPGKKLDIGAERVVGEMLEAHAALTYWAGHLERELARYGHKIARVAKGPTIIVQQGYRIVDGVQHPMMQSIPCPHDLIDTAESAAEVTCRTCGTLVNAAWWIARHAERIELAERRFVETRKEQRSMLAELEDLKAERKKLKDAVRRGKESLAKQRRP